MFNKKSVIGGLLLSASTLGVVGGAVAIQNEIDAPVQKENVQKGLTGSVARNMESLKSKALSNKKTVIDNKSNAQTANSVSDTTVETTSVSSAESMVEPNYVSEPTVTPINDFTYTVVNSAQSNSANDVTTLTYQAKPALVDTKESVVDTEPDLDSIIVDHNRLVGENRVEASESENKVESELVAESTDNVKSTDISVEDVKSVEESVSATENAVTSKITESNLVENPVSEPSVASEPIVTEVQAPAVPENQVVSAEPVVDPAPIVENVEPSAPTVSEESVKTEESAPTQERPQYSSTADSYPIGECTWGVKTVAPWVGDYWGNGGQWAESAAKDGFRTGKTAEVGSVVSWNDGGYGHVAYVTDVDQTTGYVKVLESNYNGNRTIQDHRGWFDASDPMWGEATYIYQN